MIFVFGEAEKGEHCKPVVCRSLETLVDICGNPPADSEGLFFAIQFILCEQELIFFRVEQEGFSLEDYFYGLKLLHKKRLHFPLKAVCMPGIGNSEVIHTTTAVCSLHRAVLIVSEKDLYDYLTL